MKIKRTKMKLCKHCDWQPCEKTQIKIQKDALKMNKKGKSFEKNDTNKSKIQKEVQNRKRKKYKKKKKATRKD